MSRIEARLATSATIGCVLAFALLIVPATIPGDATAAPKAGNLFFPNCAPPPTVNAVTTCLGNRPGFLDFQVKNGGSARSGRFQIRVEFDRPGFTDVFTQTLSSLGPEEMTTVSQQYDGPNQCVFDPDCFFTVTIVPLHPKKESNLGDNVFLGTILG